MAQGASFVIEETTGQRRSIILRTRALPYRNPNWGGVQRVKTTWYAGNPVGTLQVLGPEERPTRIQGTWKDRFVTAPGVVEVSGFPAVQSAHDIVQIFDSLRLNGNALRVQWGDFVRSGVLSEFEARPIRVEDIEWTAEFEWSSADERKAPVASAAKRPQSEMREAQNGVDDEFAFEPRQVLPNFGAISATRIQNIRGLVSEQLDALRAARRAIEVPREAAQSVASAAQSIRSEVDEEREALAGVPYTQAQITDGVVDVLTVERWRRSTSIRLRALSATSLVEAQTIEEEFAPPGFKIVTMPGHGSLRLLSRDVYGNADDWRRLAKANGFKVSTVDPGTLVVVPPVGTPVR